MLHHPKTIPLANTAHRAFTRTWTVCILILIGFAVIHADPVKQYHARQNAQNDYDMLYAQAYALSKPLHKKGR